MRMENMEGMEKGLRPIVEGGAPDLYFPGTLMRSHANIHPSLVYTSTFTSNEDSNRSSSTFVLFSYHRSSTIAASLATCAQISIMFGMMC
eukprot:g70933.t1